jgi:aromatic-L-amino-acid/L-tryptophan decarboxylase
MPKSFERLDIRLWIKVSAFLSVLANAAVIDYFKTISDRPVLPSVEPGFMRKSLPTEIPVEGVKWDEIHPDIERIIMVCSYFYSYLKEKPGITHWQHPKFFSWFPSNSTYPGILGEIYSSMFNGAAFNWICSPSVTECLSLCYKINL